LGEIWWCVPHTRGDEGSDTMVVLAILNVRGSIFIKEQIIRISIIYRVSTADYKERISNKYQ